MTFKKYTASKKERWYKGEEAKELKGKKGCGSVSWEK